MNPAVVKLQQSSNEIILYKNTCNSSTWRRVTWSDDFKPSDAITLYMLTHSTMYPAAFYIGITIIGSNATCVSDAFIKTLSLCCCWLAPPDNATIDACVWIVIDTPAMWAVDSRRCCRCWTELLHSVIVIWVNKQTVRYLTIVKTDYALC